MLIALTTFSFTAAEMMLAWGTPARHNLARAGLRDGDFALAERCVR